MAKELGWTRYHPAVLALTFSSYALLHVVRKTLSFVKTSVISEWTPSPLATTTGGGGDGGGGGGGDDTWTRGGSLFADEASAEAFLGLLNATFLFVYALGLYVSGALADRLDLRLLLSGGMALSGLALFLFGPVLHWAAAWSQPAYLGLMMLNGLLQSAGWPCVVAVMANWFGKNSRGFVLGLWSASPSVGSIVGALLASTVVDYGYEYVFIVSSSMALAGSVVVFFGLVTSPREVGLPMPDEVSEDSTILCPTHQDETSVLKEEVRSKSSSTASASGALIRNTMNRAPCCDRTASPVNTPSSERPAGVNTPPMRRPSTPHSCYGSFHSTPGSLENTHPEATKKVSSAGNGLLYKIMIPNRSWSRQNSEEGLLRSVEADLVEDRDSYVDTNLDVEEEEDKGKCENPFSKALERKLAALNNAQPEKADQLSDSSIPERATDPGSNREKDRCLTGPLARDDHDTEDSPENKNSFQNPRGKAIHFCAALRLPGVIPYSSAFAFLKMVNYVFFFWLPFYLTSAYGWSQATADQLSVWFDVGAIVGATVAGALTGWWDKRALVMGPMLALGVPALYAYGTLPLGRDPAVNAAMLVLLGALIGGVSNIISAAISADLGRQEAICGNQEALSTVAGIIEGTGTLGAAVGQVAVPYLNAAYGWRSVFYLMMAAVSLTVLNLLPMIVHEFKGVLRNRASKLEESRRIE